MAGQWSWSPLPASSKLHVFCPGWGNRSLSVSPLTPQSSVLVLGWKATGLGYKLSSHLCFSTTFVTWSQASSLISIPCPICLFVLLVLLIPSDPFSHPHHVFHSGHWFLIPAWIQIPASRLQAGGLVLWQLVRSSYLPPSAPNFLVCTLTPGHLLSFSCQESSRHRLKKSSMFILNKQFFVPAFPLLPTCTLIIMPRFVSS